MQTLVSNESLIVGLIWRCKAPTVSRFNTLYNCDMLSSPIIDFSSFAFLTNLHYRFCGRSLNSSGTFCIFSYFMMTSSNGNIFRVTGHLCGEFTGHRWISRTKASDAELWCFLWSAPEYMLNKQCWSWWFETPSSPLWRHCNVNEEVLVQKLAV